MNEEAIDLGHLLHEIYYNYHSLNIFGLGEVTTISVKFKEHSELAAITIKRIGYLSALTVFYRDNRIYDTEITSERYGLILNAVIGAITIKEGENE